MASVLTIVAVGRAGSGSGGARISKLSIHWLDSLRPVPPVTPPLMGLDFDRNSRESRGGDDGSESELRRKRRNRVLHAVLHLGSARGHRRQWLPSAGVPACLKIQQTEVRRSYSALSSSATSVTDFFASPNSIVVPSA